MKIYNKLSIGLKVSVVGDPLSNVSFLSKRNRYLNLEDGMQGSVIGFSSDGKKAAVEFDHIIWTGFNHRVSKFDNGCNGTGAFHKCAYIPTDYLVACGVNTEFEVSLNMYANNIKIIVDDLGTSDGVSERYSNKVTRDVDVLLGDNKVFNFIGNYGECVEAIWSLNNGGMSFTVYETTEDTYRDKYRLYCMKPVSTNIETTHLLSYNYKPVTVTVCKSNSDGKNYAGKTLGCYFIYKGMDDTEKSDTLSRLAKVGGEVVITKWYYDRLDLSMLVNKTLQFVHGDITYKACEDTIDHMYNCYKGELSRYEMVGGSKLEQVYYISSKLNKEHDIVNRIGINRNMYVETRMAIQRREIFYRDMDEYTCVAASSPALMSTGIRLPENVRFFRVSVTDNGCIISDECDKYGHPLKKSIKAEDITMENYLESVSKMKSDEIECNLEPVPMWEQIATESKYSAGEAIFKEFERTIINEIQSIGRVVRIHPTTIGMDLIPVQPMSEPSLIFSFITVENTDELIYSGYAD